MNCVRCKSFDISLLESGSKGTIWVCKTCNTKFELDLSGKLIRTVYERDFMKEYIDTIKAEVCQLAEAADITRLRFARSENITDKVKINDCLKYANEFITSVQEIKEALYSAEKALGKLRESSKGVIL
jgi:hypothetical protein